MKYCAFLRGINISGKNKIPMAELKSGFEQAGFAHVSTYLNSGNVVFSSDCLSPLEIRAALEGMIRERFGLDIPVYVIPQERLTNLLSHAPQWWGTDDKEMYDNLIFILSKDTAQAAAEQIGPLSDGLEQAQVCGEVIFWTFERSSYQKCNWWKATASPALADKFTIRTAGTVKKCAAK